MQLVPDDFSFGDQGRQPSIGLLRFASQVNHNNFKTPSKFFVCLLDWFFNNINKLCRFQKSCIITIKGWIYDPISSLRVFNALRTSSILKNTFCFFLSPVFFGWRLKFWIGCWTFHRSVFPSSTKTLNHSIHSLSYAEVSHPKISQTFLRMEDIN